MTVTAAEAVKLCTSETPWVVLMVVFSAKHLSVHLELMAIMQVKWNGEIGSENGPSP